MSRNLTSKTFKNLIWLSSSSGIESILSVLIISILARILTPEEFGTAHASLIVIGFASIINQMGIGPALVQREKLSDVHIRVGLSISCVFGICLFIVFYILSNTIARFLNIIELSKILKILSVVFIVESLSVVPSSILQKRMQMKVYSWIGMVSHIVGYGLVSIILGYLNFGVMSIIYGSICQSVVRMICLNIYVKYPKTPILKKNEILDLLHFGGGYTLARVASYISLNGDNLIIGKYLGSEMLGFYSRSYSIMVKPVSLFGGALDKAIFPAMSSIQNSKKKLAEAYFNGVMILSLISLPISVMIYVSSSDIIYILLGPEWKESILPLQILSIGFVFRMGYKISDSLARATGAVYRRAWRQIVYAIVMICGSLVGSRWGIVGVSISVVISIFLNYIMMADLALRLIDKRWEEFLKAHLNGIITCLIFTILYVLIYNLVSFYSDLSILRIAIAPIMTLVIILLIMANSSVLRSFVMDNPMIHLVWSKFKMKFSND